MSKAKTLLIVFTCALALIVAGSAFAQSDTETYEFDDGTVTEYPADWVLDDFGSYIILTNTEDAMDLYNDTASVEEGGIVVLLGSPGSLVDLNMDSDAEPRDVVEEIMSQTDLDGDIEEDDSGGFTSAYAEVSNTQTRQAGITAAIVAFTTPNGTCFMVIQTGDTIPDYGDELALIISSLVGEGSSVQPTATSRSGGNPPPRGGATPTPTQRGSGNPPPRGGSTPVPAGSASIEGELTRQITSELFVVSLQEGDTITVEMVADDDGFDTIVRLYAPGDYERGRSATEFNDDSGDSGSLNSRIEDFDVTESGDWVIEATSFGEAGAGTYVLTVSGGEEYVITPMDGAVPTEEPVPTEEVTSADAQPISYGESVQGELTTRQPEQFCMFTGSAGDVVTIEMASDESEGVLDTRLYLYLAEDYTPGGLALADNDDSADDNFGYFNSRIEEFELPESGEYLIVASSFAQAGAGQYTLTLLSDSSGSIQPTATSRSGGNPPPRGATATPEPPASGGSTIAGEFTADSTTQQYVVSLNEGDIITIELAADGNAFDPLLNLYAPGGFEAGDAPAESNDDSSDSAFGRLNSRIEDFEVTDSGDWVIEATSYTGAEVGTYTITVYGDEAEYVIQPLGDEPAPTEEPVSDATTIAYNEPVVGELTADAAELVYQFEGTAGDVVTILMLAADDKTLDPLLYLYSAADYAAGGDALTENDDSGDADFGRFNSRIEEFELPETGSYVIVATSFASAGTGAFTLTVVSGDVPAPTEVPVSGELRQWASSASATSEYGPDSWSAQQATGEPDTDTCGDATTAWASESSRGNDTLTVEFDVAVIPLQVNIYQTYNPGAIIEVRLITEDGDVIIVPDSADPLENTPCPGVFTLDIVGVDAPVTSVAIDLNQKLTGSWNEIDAVELVGELP